MTMKTYNGLRMFLACLLILCVLVQLCDMIFVKRGISGIIVWVNIILIALVNWILPHFKPKTEK